MAEYYPLLAKAIGSLPNSSPETRRVVYERARKALIGQLRTLHPPVPDDDIERESVELDRAVERLEAELADGITPPPPARPPAPPAQAPTAPPPPPPASALDGAATPVTRSKPPVPDRRPLLERKPLAPRPPLRPAPKPVVPPPATKPPPPAVGATILPAPAQRTGDPAPPPAVAREPLAPPIVDVPKSDPPPDPPPVETDRSDDARRLKPPQRPIAPQPPAASAPKRRLWIIPLVLAVVVAIVAVAAWKLRDRPETLARKPTEQTQTESGKIAERVGGDKPSTSAPEQKEETAPASPQGGTQPSAAPPTQTRPPANPELPVARRAALLVEAPDEANKVKTFVGSVVWKLNNAPQGANAAVGLAVEADVDLPDDKLKAIITFEKNPDASLPASHTIKVRFVVEPGSFSGGIKQISVPQMRPEASPTGEPLAGVTVQIVPNSFLVGLSPGNAEAANIDLMRRLQWVDIPMLLDSGKIAKLTFEKGDSGRRDLDDAFEAWQK